MLRSVIMTRFIQCSMSAFNRNTSAYLMRSRYAKSLLSYRILSRIMLAFYYSADFWMVFLR